MKNCKYCNSEFNESRADQLFCSPKCRYSWHYAQKKPHLKSMREVSKSLYRNWHILKELAQTEKWYDFQFLHGRRFNFNTFTGRAKSEKDGKPVLIIYDYELILDADKKVGYARRTG